MKPKSLSHVISFLGLAFISQLAGPSAQAIDFSYLSVLNARRPEPISVSNSDNWMAVVGDSAATGAVSSPNIKATFSSVLGKLGEMLIHPEVKFSDADIQNIPQAGEFGLGPSLPPPSRVYFSSREYDLAKQRGGNSLIDLNYGAKGSAVLDTPQYSFGYLFGRAKQIEPKDILFVAQDGQRVDSIANQFNRIAMANQATLPPLILLSFTANDLCDDRIFAESSEKRISEFEAQIRQQFKVVFESYKSHAKGTQIIVVAPLNVANVVSNPQLLKQEIDFGLGQRIQCQTLRDGHLSGPDQAARDKLIGMCNSVLKTRPDDRERLQKITEIQEGFVDVWDKLVKEWNSGSAPKGFNFRYVRDTWNIQFEEGDVANDCFHPSILAHQKIARILLGR